MKAAALSRCNSSWRETEASYSAEVPGIAKNGSTQVFAISCRLCQKKNQFWTAFGNIFSLF